MSDETHYATDSTAEDHENEPVRTSEFASEHVPIALFGKDHWSTFAYIETRIVDGGFRITGDPKMRTCRRCWRIANHGKLRHRTIVSVYPTRLRDGRLADLHCDWDCVQDLIVAGLLATSGDVDLGKAITLTDAGFKAIAALREHKANGRNFGEFAWTGAAS
jgi:hypothetical protein